MPPVVVSFSVLFEVLDGSDRLRWWEMGVGREKLGVFGRVVCDVLKVDFNGHSVMSALIPLF